VRADRTRRNAGRFIACGLSAWLTACSIGRPGEAGPGEAALRAAWVELGPGGIAIARAVVEDAACPPIAIDGRAPQMAVRAAPATLPLRPTANPPAESKPASFPVTICEFTVPEGALRASVGGRALPLPKRPLRRIVVLGDSGCRVNTTENALQACDDPAAWPLAEIAATAARFAPDLVIHVGDYLYRETACPPTFAGCRGSPWGYGWGAWQADLFGPAAPLLAAAPWIVVRGNHEVCARAGQGWFRLLDPHPFDSQRSCDDPLRDGDADYSPTYAVPLGDQRQVLVFDSAKAYYRPLSESDPQFGKFRAQFAEARALAAPPGVASIFTGHHPLLGFVPQRDAPPLPGNAALQSVAVRLFGPAYFPPGVALALHGHIHDFQALGFAGSQPATLVVGIGGGLLDPPLPDPFPPDLAPAPDATIAAMVHAGRFGFMLLERREADWSATAHARNGTVLARCLLSGTRLRCGREALGRR
jgi:hypothetical protein